MRVHYGKHRHWKTNIQLAFLIFISHAEWLGIFFGFMFQNYMDFLIFSPLDIFTFDNRYTVAEAFGSISFIYPYCIPIMEMRVLNGRHRKTNLQLAFLIFISHAEWLEVYFGFMFH